MSQTRDGERSGCVVDVGIVRKEGRDEEVGIFGSRIGSITRCLRSIIGTVNGNRSCGNV